MKLKSFEIRLYRSCIKTDLPIHAELTGLIGINGAGKSNILNAILLLRKISRSRYVPSQEKDPSSNKCYIKVEMQHENKSFYMKGDVIFETGERNLDDVQYTRLKWNFRNFTNDSKWLDFPFEFFALREPHHYTPYEGRRIPEEFYYRFYKAQDMIPKKVHPLIHQIDNFFNGINYYSASQFSDPSRCPVSIELEDNRPVRRLRSFVGHEQFIHDLYKSYKDQDKQYKRYLNTVNKDGIGLIDDIEFTEVEMPSSFYEVQQGGKIKKIEKIRLLIVPSFSVEGSKLSPNQLSEGTFKTLALLFYVLTVDSKLLLIEEPEVCIHHGLLSSIISLIKTQSKEKQIVMSTHSDFVLDHLDPENLVLIKRQTNKGTTAKPLSKSMSRNDYKALRSYLEESGNLGEYWKEGGFEDE